MSTIEELLGRKSSGSGPENRDYGSGDPSRWPRSTLYPQKLALSSPTSGDRSVGIVRARTKGAEFSFFYLAKQHAIGWSVSEQNKLRASSWDLTRQKAQDNEFVKVYAMVWES
jgi:hypothetical protein